MTQPEPLLILEGVFHDPGTGLSVFPDGGDPRNVGDVLAPYEGRVVHLSLHHYPPSPPDPGIPGGGSCLWGGLCPCGHQKDPAWLFNIAAKGVLKHLPSGIWVVEEDRIPLIEMMTGHRGRLVLFTEAEVSQDKGVDDLLGEAEGLITLLEGLRGALKS
jgi:hypothetical protein